MATTMESIRDMVDVNTVIGEPISTGDGSTVIPISKVCFGFVAGGADYEAGHKSTAAAVQEGDLPFAGGTGAGVSVQPMGFLVVSEGQVRLLPAQHYAPLDRVIELAPQVLTELKNWIGAMVNKDGKRAPDAP